MFAWLSARLSERTSQAAIAVLLTAISTIAMQPAAWAPGALSLWLGIIPTLTPCLIAVLVPEGTGATLASLAADRILLPKEVSPETQNSPSPSPTAAIAIILALACAPVLSACAPDGSLSAGAQTVIKAACIVDGVAQPIAVSVGGALADVTGYGEEAKLAAALDGKVHTAVQTACANLGGAVAPAAK